MIQTQHGAQASLSQGTAYPTAPIGYKSFHKPLGLYYTSMVQTPILFIYQSIYTIRTLTNVKLLINIT